MNESKRERYIRLLSGILKEKDITEVSLTRDAAREIVELLEEFTWTPVEEKNPEIDMTYSHSDSYLVTYESGGIDVASYRNVNLFWTDHIVDPYWWGAQYCKVKAWMKLPKEYEE